MVCIIAVKKCRHSFFAPKSDNDVSQPLQLGSGSAQDKVKIPSKAGKQPNDHISP